MTIFHGLLFAYISWGAKPDIEAKQSFVASFLSTFLFYNVVLLIPVLVNSVFIFQNYNMKKWEQD